MIDDAGNDRDVAYADPTYDAERLRKAAYVARGITLVLFLALFIIWPLRYASQSFDHSPERKKPLSEFPLTLYVCSLYGTAYMFSKKFFTGWVIVSLLWAFFSFFSVTVFPIIEGRHLLLSWVKALFGKSGKGGHSDEFDHHIRRQQYEESDGSATASKEKESANETAAPVLTEKDSEFSRV